MFTTTFPLWLWIGFALFVVVALVIDLVVLNAKAGQKVSIKEATIWSLIWFGISFIFAGFLYWYLGNTGAPDAAAVAKVKTTEFITGYLIEKSLSIDNIFVFLMLFTYFAVPAEYQRRVLVIGVIGAIVLRAIMIFLGAVLLAKVSWLLYIFGAFLLFTGIKMLIFADDKPDIEKNPVLKFMRKKLNMTNDYHGDKFMFLKDGVKFYTPLFVVMVMIAVTDIIFAVDSIPAIFAITDDPFIVLTANIFAILGLRALYFLLADMADRFHYLSYGLASVLIFVGIKMLIVKWYHVPVGISLGVVGSLILASVVASFIFPKKEEPARLESKTNSAAG
jgi:tellurite resistance protein TerC